MSTVAGTGDSSAVNGLARQEAQATQEMTNEDFLQLLIAQVQHQNPLEPMKNHELMAQMTEIKSLEATASLVEHLEQMTSGMELASASELVGQPVYGYAEDGTRVVGEVQGLWTQNGKVNLVVEGYPLLPVDNVESSGIDLTAAVALIGCRARGTTAGGFPVTGVVEDLIIRQGKVNLVLDTYQLLPIENVVEVVEEGSDDGA